jgi:hypothetical protein
MSTNLIEADVSANRQTASLPNASADDAACDAVDIAVLRSLARKVLPARKVGCLPEMSPEKFG